MLLHLVINALSTLLLSASNYAMQCLSSLTRKEVEKGHRHYIWLDIDVPSVRNLRRISRGRATFWWLLGIPGIPLHLLYNGAVTTRSSQDYFIFAASFDLFTSYDLNWSALVHHSSPENKPYALRHSQNASFGWERLGNERTASMHIRLLFRPTQAIY